MNFKVITLNCLACFKLESTPNKEILKNHSNQFYPRLAYILLYMKPS